MLRLSRSTGTDTLGPTTPLFLSKGKTNCMQATADMARFGCRTSSLLIVKNGRIALERYWGGHEIHTAQRTFSDAKSMAVTLIGHAVQQGRDRKSTRLNSSH